MRLYEVFESYCNNLCWPLTSMTSVHFQHFRHLRLQSWPPILSSFSSLLTFSRALALFWARWLNRMAVRVIYRTKYATLRIASPYITRRIYEQECLHSERKVLSPDFKESEDAENFERNCKVCLRAISWIWEWTIIFFHWYVDKRKQNSKPFTERNVIITCSYLSASHWILLRSFMRCLFLKGFCVSN